MAKITSTATETIIGAGSNDNALTVDQSGGFNGGQLAGMRNLIINGAFNINQRVYASGAAVGALLYAHDRWKMAASADTYTFSTTANKTTVTIPAGKVLQQVVEGLNLQTGTYVLSWEGTAQGKIGAGAYGNTGLTNTITGGVDTTIEFGPGTVSNVQLEWGTRASPFERRFLGLELQLCQRYYQRLGGQVANDILYQGYLTSGTATCITLTYPAMRASAVATKVGTWGISQLSGQPTIIAAGVGTVSIQGISNLTGQCSFSTISTATYVELSAEL